MVLAAAALAPLLVLPMAHALARGGSDIPVFAKLDTKKNTNGSVRRW